MGAYIKAISYYLPEKTLTNTELCELFPELNDDDIFRRTGVRQRHISAPLEIGSDVAYASGLKFFEEQQVNRDEIDFLLFCTEGLDYKAPTSACVLQDRLELPKSSGAMDIPMGCTGFVYGLGLAKGLIETHQLRNVLLLTSDVPSKVIHPEDQELRMIFGDAGAATLISNGYDNVDSSIGQFVFGTDGSGAKNLMVNYSGAREPMTKDWLDEYKDADGMKWGKMKMNGVEIFIFSIRVVPPMIDELLAKNEITFDQVDLFIFHQANGYLLEILRKKLKIPREKFFVSMAQVGNTVSATIPIALHEAQRAKVAKKGDRIMLVSFGIGYSWSGTLITL
jgi:3-oxoacyl-[acyl-carrier-protein] synthase-3